MAFKALSRKAAPPTPKMAIKAAAVAPSARVLDLQASHHLAKALDNTAACVC
jgi:hypothetical protein